MKQLLTNGIILGRTDYGEADRIITVLTPDRGKLRLMARGVRKIKSKLAGGIELFSTSHITFIEGKGEIGTLISTRLIRHYGHIIDDIDRVQLGYELLKQLDRTTEDQPEADYYHLLEQAFAALDDARISTGLIRVWFEAQLLKLAGHTPNLSGIPDAQKYLFDFEQMTFVSNQNGRFTRDDIKFLRLLFGGNKPAVLVRVEGSDELAGTVGSLISSMWQTFA